MNKNKIFLLSILFLLLNSVVIQATEVSEFDQVFSNLEKSIKKVTLKNGLRLIMVKKDYAPVVAAYMKFKAGAADEKKGSWGIAHMLEHMLFKGTKIVGTNNYDREKKYHYMSIRWMEKLDRYKRIADDAELKNDQKALKNAKNKIKLYKRRLNGIHQLSRRYVIAEEDSYLYSLHGSSGYNAYTMADLTNYQIQLPSNRLEVWARLESDRLANATLRDFYHERNVVREERRMRYNNSPSRSMYEKLMEKVYGQDHPYGKSVIGPMQSIRYLNYKKAMKFYRTYYAPNNSVIALVGDLEYNKTKNLVQKYFGPLKSKTIPARPKVPEPIKKKFDLQIKKKAKPLLILAWLKPAMPHKSDTYANLLSDILTSGSESRLYKRLVIQKKLASSVGAYNGYPGERYTNLFIVQITANKIEDYELIKQEVQNELHDIRKNAVLKSELDRVKNIQKANFIYKLGSNAFLADQLSYFEMLFGDYRILFRYYTQFSSVSEKNIQDFTSQYLSENFRMSVSIVPEK